MTGSLHEDHKVSCNGLFLSEKLDELLKVEGVFLTKKMVLKKYNVTMEKEKEGVVPNIYFLCRCLSVTESVDGFYCACGRKLSFAAQGKGKKTVVYCISVIHRNSDHYIDRYGAFLQGDSDSLPAQYRNGCSVFWKKFVA